ncbi:CatB-related O-acetyltransferase [Roseobacteraceae bacterium S113]
MTRAFPDPDTRHPIILPDGSPHLGTVFLKAAVDHPRFDVGDYSYASAHTPPEDWAAHLAPYLYPTSPERLSIGKFCQIADGVQFITASANHRYDGATSYPFAVMQGEFSDRPSMPGPGPDTRIGNDVWIGSGARIMPGAQVGDGVIVGAGAVVVGQVPPYSIIVGNPSRPVRRRFDAETVEALRTLAWWDWPIERVLAEEAALCGDDPTRLQELLKEQP